MTCEATSIRVLVSNFQDSDYLHVALNLAVVKNISYYYHICDVCVLAE